MIMNGITPGKLLLRLIQESKELGNRENAPFTAERLLIAIIEADSILDGENDNEPVELHRALGLLKDAFGSLVRAKDALYGHTTRVGDVTFLDEMYMNKRMRDAEVIAKELGESEIDTVMIVKAILATPSKAVRDIISARNKPEPEETKSEEDDTEALGKAIEALLSGEDGEDGKDGEISDTVISDSYGKSVSEDRRTPEKAREEMSGIVTEVRRIRSELQSIIFGQDNAINVFASGLFHAKMLSLTDKRGFRPRATFLFAGPPGVGKTFLAEKAAEALGMPFRRFDMSEYADKEANLEFCGSDKVYKNAKAGNVTDFVAKNPKCVLLFDEIEKAHICVIHLFLQMLDAGRLRDNYTDEEVSFKDTIIILTTNAGKQLYEESEGGDFSSVPRKVIIKALQKDTNPETGIPYFPGALCSRFASGNVVMFNHIGAHNLREIAKREIERRAEELFEETGIKIQIGDKVYTALLFAEGSAADARTVRSRAETFFNDELYELMRLVTSKKSKKDVDSIERININVDLSGTGGTVSELFRASEKTRMLVFSSDETVSLCADKLYEFEIFGARDVETAVEILKNQSIDMILLDMNVGAEEPSFDNLNIEDVESPARDFFKFLREQGIGIPTYLIETDGSSYSDEERVSFTRQGVRDVIHISGYKPVFPMRLKAIAESLHQQASMTRLARENKIVSFETAQAFSRTGKTCEIRLFDFKLGVSVDAEDAGSILGAVSRPNVRFADVIGGGDAKRELTYFVEYLKNPKKYMGTGVKAPRGVLLYGPPGTGKTMLAKAMACEAGITFIAAQGNQFLKRYVGEGADEVHALFRTARKYAPAILFIDEIDAVAGERGNDMRAGSGGDEALNAFLNEMDGFVSDPSKPVFVLAATNFDVEPGSARSLDPALMRRFDRRILIDLPNKQDRIAFLNMKLAKNRSLKISSEQLDNIAMRSTGMSLAALDSVIELALRSAIREGRTEVNDEILEEAFETFNNGDVKKWDVSQLERVARHESGHAFLCYISGETPSYLTVVARGDHGGYMQHADREGKAIYTRDELLSRIRTSLGGRAAELVYYGERDGISTGASGDLISATNLARQIVCTYGMDEDFGLAVFTSNDGSMTDEVRSAVNKILREEMKEAVRIISENREKIDVLVERLMTENHLNGAEIEAALA